VGCFSRVVGGFDAFHSKLGLTVLPPFVARINRWFKKKLPRSEASALLRVEQHEGSFLVRESESKPGEYSLSVRYAYANGVGPLCCQI
jgi:hypothetical protein